MSFDLQPFLSGDFLELRPLQEEDYDALYSVASDPRIWEQHPVRDRYKEVPFRKFFTDSLNSGGALVAIDKENDRIIGSSRFHGYNPAESEIEIGWTFLACSYWGGRFNGEMKRLMLQHAFKFVDKVVLLVGPENIRSQKAAEKIGGIRSGWRLDGGGRKSIVFEITANSYSQRKQL